MPDTLEQLIDQYGYWAVLVGCIIEGEISLLLGAVAVNEELLRLSGVMLAAFTGTMIADVGFYYIGRFFGRAILARLSLRLQARARLAERLAVRHGALAIIGFRFLYGLRIVATIVLGSLNIPPWRFILLSILGAALWTLIFTALGMLVANTVEAVMDYTHQAKTLVFLLLLLLALAAVVLYLVRRFRSRNEIGRASSDQRNK